MIVKIIPFLDFEWDPNTISISKSIFIEHFINLRDHLKISYA